MLRNFLSKAILKNAKTQKLKKAIDSARPKREGWKKEILKLRKEMESASSDEQKAKIQVGILNLSAVLDRTSRVSSVKYRKTCRLTGRTRGLKFGVCRGYFRSHAGFGQVSGIRKF